jgi:hypothetical protein
VSGVPAENSAVWTGEQWAGLHSHSITIPALTVHSVQPMQPAYAGICIRAALGEDVDAAMVALIREAQEDVEFGGITRQWRRPNADGSTTLAVEFLVQG